jgi:hypothetical protein
MKVDVNILPGEIECRPRLKNIYFINVWSRSSYPLCGFFVIYTFYPNRIRTNFREHICFFTFLFSVLIFLKKI